MIKSKGDQISEFFVQQLLQEAERAQEELKKAERSLEELQERERKNDHLLQISLEADDHDEAEWLEMYSQE